MMEEKAATMGILAKLGLGNVEHFDGSEFDYLCSGLNLLLCICGHGVVLQQAKSLGEKVRVSEKLIHALEDAGCNLELRPHQLSGLDWKEIRLVAQWICRRVEKKREEVKQDAHTLYDDFLLSTRTILPSRKALGKASERTTDDEIPEDIPSQVHEKALTKLEKNVFQQDLAKADLVSHLTEVTSLAQDLRAGCLVETDKSLRKLDHLAALVERNEHLKANEKEFKLTCRKERERLSAIVDTLASKAEEEEAELSGLLEIRRRISARLARARVSLASVSRHQATEARAVDNAPTKGETIQFERRFAELYEQMTLKSDEHRKHMTTYNTLSTKLRLLQDHVALIKSIRDGFAVSASSLQSANDFALQLPAVLEGFDRSLDRSKDKTLLAGRRRDAAEMELQALLTKQRTYYRAVRELQEAFIENERLARSNKV